MLYEVGSSLVVKLLVYVICLSLGEKNVRNSRFPLVERGGMG